MLLDVFFLLEAFVLRAGALGGGDGKALLSRGVFTWLLAHALFLFFMLRQSRGTQAK